MTALIHAPDIEQKLKILSDDARYDLACACAGAAHRKDGSTLSLCPTEAPASCSKP